MYARSVVAVAAALVLAVAVARLPTAAAYVTVLATGRAYAHRSAEFGPVLTEVGVVGTAVSLRSISVGNEYGCDLTSWTPPDNTSTAWIALVVETLSCSYSDQVRAMQQSGALAVIVGARDFNGPLVSMIGTGDTSDIEIPSVYMLAEDFYELRADAESEFATYPSFLVSIVPYPGGYWPLVNVLIARVVAPTIIVILMYSLAFRFRRRNREQKQCAKESLVKNLPTRRFTTAKASTATLASGASSSMALSTERAPLLVNEGGANDDHDEGGAPAARSMQTLASVGDDEPDVCPICLDEYAEGDMLRILPCKHEFHVTCVDKWLITRKRYCPLCKMDACPTEGSPLV